MPCASRTTLKSTATKSFPRRRGEAAAILQAADGYKQSIVTKAQGDAARFNATYAAYLEGKDVTP